MGISAGPQIIRDSSLVLGLDASDANSNYRSTGRIWNDLSGNNNTGSIVNGATLNNDGYGSFVFNGANSYITLARPVQDDFTLSCWFKTSQSTGTGQWYTGVGLIDGEVANAANDFGLAMVGGKAAFGVGNPDVTISSSLSYNDANWHQVTATRIRSTGVITLYVDGSSIATSTGSTNSLTAPPTLRIGSIQTSNTGFFSGSIANVQIYNKALSVTEIQNNYNQYLPRFTSPTPNIITYTSLNQAAAISMFNDDIEFSNIIVGYPYTLANAIVTSNSPSI